MKVGFTGTRKGMTDEQRHAFVAWVKTSGVTEFHYGVCVGADGDAWDVVASASDLGFEKPRVVAHPPTDPKLRLHSTMMFDDEVRPEADYLTRNHDIVDAIKEDGILVASPGGREEQWSGTWSTIRYARRIGAAVLIIWPDGTTTEESRL